MPLIITRPGDNEPFGPGFTVSVESDFIGPFEPGSYWQLILNSVPAEDPIANMIVPLTAHTLNRTFVDQNGSIFNPVPGRTGWLTGDAAVLSARIFNPANELLETTSVSVELDRQSGQVAELAEWMKVNIAAAGQALTEEEHDAIIITQAAVTADIGPNIGDLIQSIGKLIINPPLAVGSLSSPPYELEGDGEIPDIGEITNSKFGLYWLATEIPPGLGRVHGNTDEFQNRLVQFRTLHALGGVELVTEIFDANWHGGLWTWKTPKPSAIEYSILPGVHLQVRWWKFP